MTSFADLFLRLGHNVHAEGEEGLTRHLTKTGTLEQGATSMLERNDTRTDYMDGKADVSPV